MSVDAQHENLEIRIRTYLEARENNRAAQVAIELFGAEILGWLCGVFQDDSLASTIYDAFRTDLPRELWAFDGHCPFRPWTYGVARKAAFRNLRSPSKQDLPLGASVAPTRDRALQDTSTWLKTQLSASAFSRLRDRLTPEERMLLILRVDRQMTWEEVARVMENPSSPATLRECAGRLRRYFHRVRDRLRQLAVEEGLIERTG